MSDQPVQKPSQAITPALCYSLGVVKADLSTSTDQESLSDQVPRPCDLSTETKDSYVKGKNTFEGCWADAQAIKKLTYFTLFTASNSSILRNPMAWFTTFLTRNDKEAECKGIFRTEYRTMRKLPRDIKEELQQSLLK